MERIAGRVSLLTNYEQLDTGEVYVFHHMRRMREFYSQRFQVRDP